MLRRRVALVGAGAALVTHRSQCSRSPVKAGSTGNRVVGSTADGEPVVERTLRNGSLTVKVLDLGAIIHSVRVPDKRGVVQEVTLGFDEVKPYYDGTSPYFGCAVGRVANRTANATFSLDGQSYKLAANNGPNHLHGGLVGWDKKVWYCEAQSETSLTLALLSEAGDEGYPGHCIARVTYSLPTTDQLRIEYSATTDAPTPVNLTNHTYWNLRDGGRTSVLHHEIELAADLYTPVDDVSIPTGEISKVADAMDLRRRVPIGAGIAKADNGMGYDHNYVLPGKMGADGLQPVARVFEPESGRWMTVRTDQPGVQFYTGNYLDGLAGRDACVYRRHHGFCLETQAFPDSANKPQFPSIVLRPGQTYTHTTVHQFGASSSPPVGPF